MNIPDKLNFGGGELVEVSYLERAFKIKRRTAFLYLKALRIRCMHSGKKAYFSLPTFKRIMFVLSRPGMPGFVFPGSSEKTTHGKASEEGYLTEVTDEIIDKANDPAILAEMAACEGTDRTLIRKFAPKPEKRKTDENTNRT